MLMNGGMSVLCQESCTAVKGVSIRLPHRHGQTAPGLRAANGNGVLFDYLAGECEKRLRDRKTERLRGLEVDDEFEFRGVDDRQFRGRFALENEPGVSADQTIDIGQARPVAHQPAAG